MHFEICIKLHHMMSHNYVANKSKSKLMRKWLLCWLLNMLRYSDPW